MTLLSTKILITFPALAYLVETWSSLSKFSEACKVL